MFDNLYDAARPQLPRRLAIRLLHAAQLAGERPFNAVVTSPARGALPDRLLMLDDTDHTAEIAGAVVWAVYRYCPGQSAAPAPLDFMHLPQVLCLTASLATKGVLQLHAWRCVDAVVIEVPLRIAD